MHNKMHDNDYDNNVNNNDGDIKKLIFINKSKIIIAIFMLILVGYVLIFQAIVKEYSHSITCSNPILDGNNIIIIIIIIITMIINNIIIIIIIIIITIIIIIADPAQYVYYDDNIVQSNKGNIILILTIPLL